MARPLTERPVFDLFEDIMAIARIEAAITSADRRKVPVVRDFTRLARFLPDYKL